MLPPKAPMPMPQRRMLSPSQVISQLLGLELGPASTLRRLLRLSLRRWILVLPSLSFLVVRVLLPATTTTPSSA